MKKLSATNTILIVIIVLLMGYIGVAKYNGLMQERLETEYLRGARDAQVATVNQIISDLTNNGYVVVNFVDRNNLSQSIALAPVQQQAE